MQTAAQGRASYNPAMLRRASLALAALAVAALAAPDARAQRTPIDSDELARGTYSTMEALLERTILSVDVVSLRVQVDPSTARALRELAHGHAYSDARADLIVRAAIGAEHALVSLRFERDVSLGDFLEQAERQLQLAASHGIIAQRDANLAARGLPNFFARLKNGFADGDVLLYRVHPDTVRVVLRTRDGRVRLDGVIDEQGASRGVLGSYLTPGSPFREQLVRSLFD